MSREPWHIAHYTNVYKPMKNGVVSSVESFRKGQLEQGHSVYVVAPTPADRSYVQERFVFNIAAITLPNQEYPFALPYDPSITGVLRGIKPDVLHTHHPVGLGRCARNLSQRRGIPLVFTFHTWYEDFSHYFSRYLPFVSEVHVARFIRYWIRNFIKRCHHIVAPSRHAYSQIMNVYGEDLDHRDISVVPTGIDTRTFTKYKRDEARALLGWKSDETYLVSCGRLSREKNFFMLIDAVSRMETDCKLVIIGEGDLRSQLEREVERLGLGGSVQFPGNLEREHVARYFSAADLFAFASPNETQGLVVLEAMAAGTPTVVVKGGGVQDYLRDNENGMTSENHPDALARALDRALRATDLNALIEKARETATSFSVESQTRRMSEVYKQAKQKQQSSGRLTNLLLTRKS